MKRLVSLFLALALVLCACGQKAEEPATWQEQYDLGMRYLSEGEYEQAILAFEAAIEIDPKQADAYIGLAEVYTAQGDTEKAVDILDKAISEIGETDKLVEAKAALAPPEPQPTPEPSPEPTPAQDTGYTERVDRDDGGYCMNEYDSDGTLVRTTLYYADGTMERYWVYEYDSEGKLERVTYYGPDGTQEMVDEYDPMGNRVRSIQYIYNDEGELEFRQETEYDAQRNRVRDIYYGADGTVHQVDEYDTDGNRESTSGSESEPAPEPTPEPTPTQNTGYTERVDYEDGFYEVREYTPEGLLVKATMYYDSGEMDSYVTYEYDAAGSKLREAGYYADGTVYSICDFDAAGNMVREVFYKTDRSYWIAEYNVAGDQVYRATYDANGVMTSEWSSAG